MSVYNEVELIDALTITYWNAVCILLADSLSLSLALLERVLVLELGTHLDDVR